MEDQSMNLSSVHSIDMKPAFDADNGGGAATAAAAQ